MQYKIAIASTDGKVVNQHFGKAETFYIIEGDSENKEQFEIVDIRKVRSFCEGGSHNGEQLEKIIEQISDCQYVLVSRVGYRAAAEVEEKGIHIFELPGMVKESVIELLNYLEIQNLIAEYRS